MRELAEELHAARVLLDAARLLVGVELTRVALVVEGWPGAEAFAEDGAAVTESVLCEMEACVGRARAALASARSTDGGAAVDATFARAERAVDRLALGHAELWAAIQALHAAHRRLQRLSREAFHELMGRLAAM